MWTIPPLAHSGWSITTKAYATWNGRGQFPILQTDAPQEEATRGLGKRAFRSIFPSLLLEKSCVITSPVPILENPRHEAFAQALAQGATADGAYEAAGFRAHRGNAARLSANESVRARVRELQEQTSRSIAFTKQDALEFLADVVRTPIGEVDHTSRLCQERTYIEGQEQTSVRVKMPGKLDAVKVMAQLCGWNVAEKLDVTLTGPRGVLAGILKRKS